MVALNLVLTARIETVLLHRPRLLRDRHDPETFNVVEIPPTESFARYLMKEFAADIETQPRLLQRGRRTRRPWLPGTARSRNGWPGVTRDVGAATAQIERLRVPDTRGSPSASSLYRAEALASFGYRRVVAPAE